MHIPCYYFGVVSMDISRAAYYVPVCLLASGTCQVEVTAIIKICTDFR
jgi:hypothetical protein